MHKRHFYISYTYKTKDGWGAGAMMPGGITTQRKPFTPLTQRILDYIINSLTADIAGIEGRVILTHIQELEDDE